MNPVHSGFRHGIVALGLLLAAGCMRSFSEERQLDSAAFLSFPELRNSADVQLTGPRDYSFEARPGKKNRYEVEAGTYRVVVTREGSMVHDARIFVSAGQTKPIEVR